MSKRKGPATNDRIYLFGFSRGAFTIRVLVGLICDQGIIKTRPTVPVAGASEMSVGVKPDPLRQSVAGETASQWALLLRRSRDLPSGVGSRGWRTGRTAISKALQPDRETGDGCADAPESGIRCSRARPGSWPHTTKAKTIRWRRSISSGFGTRWTRTDCLLTSSPPASTGGSGPCPCLTLRSTKR